MKIIQNKVVVILAAIGAVLVSILLAYVINNSSIETAHTTGTITDKEHYVWYTYDDDGNRKKYEQWDVDVTTESGVDFTQSDRSVYRKVKVGQTVKVRVSMWYYKDNLMTTSYYIELEGD